MKINNLLQVKTAILICFIISSVAHGKIYATALRHSIYKKEGKIDFSGNEGNVQILIDNENKKHIAIFSKDNNLLKKLANKFSNDTKIDNFHFVHDNSSIILIYFKAEDQKWSVDYFWNIHLNELYFRVRNKKTGNLKHSKNIKKTTNEGRLLNDFLFYIDPSYARKKIESSANNKGKIVTFYDDRGTCDGIYADTHNDEFIQIITSYPKATWVNWHSNSLAEVGFSCGAPCHISIFVDVSNGRVSKAFDEVIAVNGSKDVVAWLALVDNKPSIILQGIFKNMDKNIEIITENFKMLSYINFDAKFLSNGNFYFKYIDSKSELEKTVNIAY